MCQDGCTTYVAPEDGTFMIRHTHTCPANPDTCSHTLERHALLGCNKTRAHTYDMTLDPCSPAFDIRSW